MPLPDVVGVHTRVAGTWERVNGGTPEGFSGPQVHNGTSFVNSVVVYGYDSAAWQTTWVNIDGEINIVDKMTFSSDTSGPPWLSFVKYFMEADGGLDVHTNNFGRFEFAHWRSFDCGREYEIKFTRTGSNAWTFPPVEDTWLDFTDPVTNHEFENRVQATIIRITTMDVRIREKVSAPAGGNDIAEMQAEVEAGNL